MDGSPRAALVEVVDRLRAHLERAGWVLRDRDRRTELWLPRQPSEIVVVLPAGSLAPDPGDIESAIRAVAYWEGRTPDELRADLAVVGGADLVSIRLKPDGAPSGTAQLPVAQAAVSALREFVVGSAASLENHDLVLPQRRPPRAEAYAAQTLLSTAPGSFIVNLALPQLDSIDTGGADDHLPPPLIDLPQDSYGKRVVNRMKAVTREALDISSRIADGDAGLGAFAEGPSVLANATELHALSSLGGPDQIRYDVRISQSSVDGTTPAPAMFTVTPAQQHVLADAAAFLREKRPRFGVTITGLVVRLYRQGNLGAGVITVQGEIDDSGRQRRIQLELSEPDYAEAMRAHGEGLMVVVRGDLETIGTRTRLRQVSGFAAIPGLED